jgi:hypothetical protein
MTIETLSIESFYEDFSKYLERLDELKALSIELVFDNMIQMMRTDDDSLPF